MKVNENELPAFLAALPAVVAVIVWDVVMDHITPKTLCLAENAGDELYEKYDVIRYLAGGNPSYCYLLRSGAMPIVDQMFEEWKVLH